MDYNTYDYGYGYGYDSGPYEMLGVIFGGTSLLIWLALMALSIVSMWFIFAKAGEPGWAAVVPFYNIFVLFKITWGNGWFMLLTLIPIANIVILIITSVYLGKVFNKSGGFIVGLVLLPSVFQPILAFGKSQFVGRESIS